MNYIPRSSHVKFSSNSQFVLISTQDSTIRLWNVQAARCVKTYSGHVNRTYCIPACFAAAIVPGKMKYVVSGSEDHRVYIWDLQAREVMQVLEGHRDVVLAVAVSSQSDAPFTSLRNQYGLRYTRQGILLLRLVWTRTLVFDYGSTRTLRLSDHSSS